jgi:hypothetical protein
LCEESLPYIDRWNIPKMGMFQRHD